MLEGAEVTYIHWLQRSEAMWVYKHQRVIGFLLRFGPKTGIHFVHFGLESGWVFWGTTGVCEHFYCARKKEKYCMRLPNRFE